MADFCKSVGIIEDISGKYPESLVSKVDWLLVKQDSFATVFADSAVTSRRNSSKLNAQDSPKRVFDPAHIAALNSE